MKKALLLFLALMIVSGCVAAGAEQAVLSYRESAVPFHAVQWGMKLKDVIAATGGEDLGNKADVQAPVEIPGLDELAAAVYHCGKKGLESVVVTIQTRPDTGIDFRETDEGAAAFDCAEAFFDGIDNSARLQLDSADFRIYRNGTSDAIVGYIPQDEGGYHLAMEFYKPIEFDQKILRNSASFYISTEYNGDILFFSSTKKIVGFDTSYSKDSRYDRTYNVIATKIQMQGSHINPTYSVPAYGLVYAYAGLVKPVDVNTMIFTVDGTMYSFTNLITTDLTITEHKEYSQNYTIWVNGSNTQFMEALEKSRKIVSVEVRGTNFNLVFDLPQKAKAVLVSDWKMYKKANGNDPVLIKMMESLKNPMTVY